MNNISSGETVFINSINKYNKKTKFEDVKNYDNNITVCKEDGYEIDNSLTTKEKFVLNKYPLFSFVPVSNQIHSDSNIKIENFVNNCKNNDTNLEEMIKSTIFFNFR